MHFLYFLLTYAISYSDTSFYSSKSRCELIQGQTLTSHKDFTEPLGNCVEIRDSIFVQITSSLSPGGAITFKNEELNSSFSVFQCVFSKCSNEYYDGGAISVEARTTTIAFTCSYDCTTPTGGQFASFRSFDDSFGEINVTTMLCPMVNKIGESVIESNLQDVRFFQNNISSWTTEKAKATGSFEINSAKNIILRENSFVNIHSGYILTLNPYECNSQIERLNFVSNSASQALIFFNGAKTITNGIFSDITASSYGYCTSTSSQLHFYSCVFDTKPEGTDRIDFTDCTFDTKTETYEIGFLDSYLCHADVTATAYIYPNDDDDDESVWKNKGVIGALSGGIIGALILGIAVGGLAIYFWKKKTQTSLVSKPLLSAPNS